MAIRVISNQLYTIESLKPFIEQHALKSLQKLLLSTPPEKSIELPTGLYEQKYQEWTANVVRSCSLLFLNICVGKKELFDQLVHVYTNIPSNTMEQEDGVTLSEPKATLLNEMNALILSLGPSHPNVINLIRNHSEQAQELALKFVEVLVDDSAKKSVPLPQDFIMAVRSVYFDRSTKNARFLIPVLTSVTRDQLKEALPDIISLPDELVRVALHRILTYGASLPSHQMHHYMTPQAVLVGLHQLDDSNIQMMKRIVFASGICFEPQYKHIFRRDVLASALQVMVDINPLPNIFMRTVIQSLNNHEDLAPAVSGVLGRLIKKRVWEREKIYEGLIKSLKRASMRPYIAEIVLQLPNKQLKQLLSEDVEIHEAVKEHVTKNKTNVNEEILQALN